MAGNGQRSGAIGLSLVHRRIGLQQELDALDALLASLPSVLAPSGRAVLISSNPAEDRRIKAAMKAGLKAGVYSEVARRVVTSPRAEAEGRKLRWCVRSPAAAE